MYDPQLTYHDIDKNRAAWLTGKRALCQDPSLPQKGKKVPVGSEFNNDMLSWAHLLPLHVKKLQSMLEFSNVFFSKSFFAVMYRLWLGFSVSRWFYYNGKWKQLWDIGKLLIFSIYRTRISFVFSNNAIVLTTFIIIFICKLWIKVLFPDGKCKNLLSAIQKNFEMSIA